MVVESSLCKALQEGPCTTFDSVYWFLGVFDYDSQNKLFILLEHNKAPLPFVPPLKPVILGSVECCINVRENFFHVSPGWEPRLEHKICSRHQRSAKSSTRKTVPDGDVHNERKPFHNERKPVVLGKCKGRCHLSLAELCPCLTSPCLYVALSPSTQRI